jgi:cobalt-zinc-cadmium efflux system membrane fusion protein
VRPLGRGLLWVGAALGFTALGAAGAVVALRGGVDRPDRPSAVAAPAAIPTPPSASDADVEIVLSPDAVARAGIKTASVTAGSMAMEVVVPGSVVANSYREVKVTPVAGGIVTRVHVELGASVRRGQPLATIFSTDLADAQTRYLSMAAMLEADHKKLERTQALVAIGAASRQELEEVTAVHAGHETEVEAAGQRLLLLGLASEQVQSLRSPSQVVSSVTIPAPIDGVITGRTANLGQVVGMGQELFVVTDLSEVWAVGDLYEQDLRAVSVGSEAAITTPAYPGTTLRGRVAYIDPRMDTQTRTAKIRVALANPDGRLRLGMFVSVAFRTPAGDRAVLVPKAAVQALGDRQVVFVAAKDEEGKFIQRTVRLGPPVGESYAVVSGLRPGDIVVTEGSFLLRAESTRNAPSS